MRQEAERAEPVVDGDHDRTVPHQFGRVVVLARPVPGAIRAARSPAKPGQNGTVPAGIRPTQAAVRTRVTGPRSVRPGLILLKASGLIALLIGVILVARSPALSRRHRIPPAPGLSCIQRGRWQPPDHGVSGEEEEPVMGVAKKAKHEAKAAKGKTKKDAGKVKHKGKKAKNAAKH